MKMNEVFKNKAIKWLEKKAFPYSKTDSDAEMARLVLDLLNQYKETDTQWRDWCRDIEDVFNDTDVDSLDINDLLNNIPGEV